MPNQVVFRRPFRKRGQNPWVYSRSLNKGTMSGTGGVEVGGAATVVFNHAPTTSDVVIEWDFDNDGDFSEAVENISEFVLGLETFTGRDWPSLLTGKAGPGKLRASLRNDDDRFSFFNSESPINTAPYSIRTGRKLRVKASGTTDTDPTRIARDRFRRAAGALGSDELGSAYIEPLADDFEVEQHRAVPTNDGGMTDPFAEHMALIDTGATDYYVQAKNMVAEKIDNRYGLVYRYVDTSNYSLCVIEELDSTIQMIDVVAGVETLIESYLIEMYAGVTLGVLVSGSEATAYLEGVPVLTVPAINGTAELAGIYVLWAAGALRPEIDEFFIWSGLPAQIEGVLWTGDVTDLTTNVVPGPQKAASLAGEGRLSKLSAAEITPPASLSGRRTGHLIGNALASALQIHPPGQIDVGDVTTGVFAMPERSALAVSRDIEELEFGFLYETQEGELSFRSRSHRDGSVSQVTFTDDPNGQFTYHGLTPYDWRSEVFNRVLAGVSPWTEGSETTLYTDPGPYVLGPGDFAFLTATYDGVVVNYTGHTRDVTAPGGDPSGISVTTDTQASSSSFVISLPATVNAGDLLLIQVGYGTTGVGTWNQSAPAGWTTISFANNGIVLAKVAAGTEDGTTITLNGTANLVWAAYIYRVTDWHGDLEGVTVSETVVGNSVNPNAPAVTSPWGEIPSLVIPFYVLDGNVNQTAAPADYTDPGSLEVESTMTLRVSSAYRIQEHAAPNPAAWTVSSARPWRARTVLVQGPTTTTQVTGAGPSGTLGYFVITYDAAAGGDEQVHSNIQVSGVPLVEGDHTFAQVDDYDSQDDHNGIRAYQNPAQLFANPADAETYANLVLSQYADDRPILSMSFYASKGTAYRMQAIRRRVGDRITIVANNNSGMGISRDFYIEAISHRWSNGKTLWECTWELSPVPE